MNHNVNVFYRYSTGRQKTREHNIVTGSSGLPQSSRNAEFVVCLNLAAIIDDPFCRFLQKNNT